MAINKGVNSNTARIYELSTNDISREKPIKDNLVTGLDYNPQTGDLTLTQNPDNIVYTNIGVRVNEIDFKGEWNKITVYKSNDKVLYYGCSWVCVKSNTNSPPRYNNKNWILAEGDPYFHMNFKCPEGFVVIGNNVDLHITAIVSAQNQIITEDIPHNNWSWNRKSIDEAGDLIWNQSHYNYGNTIHITQVDLPTGTETIQFICKAVIPTITGQAIIQEIINFQ